MMQLVITVLSDMSDIRRCRSGAALPCALHGGLLPVKRKFSPVQTLKEMWLNIQVKNMQAVITLS